ncbi:hypothetical protein [Amycolatopsis sp. lyj-23]|uniref:hypothetical protein n=1 Tax=Amycolatopsis sp. lyj-23 TaxID=2789283 RepID=UPI00397D53AC
MDFLFTLLLCAPYPALGIHTARAVLREARDRLPYSRWSCRRQRTRAWFHAAVIAVFWPAVEILPPLARWTRSGTARLRRRTHRREHSA